MARETVRIKVIEKEIERPGKSQCILVLLNLLLFIVGCTMLFIAYCTIDRKAFEKIIKFVSKQGVPKPLINIMKRAVTESKALSSFLIISGLIISIVSFLGCCGAWCSQKLLKFYRIFLFVLLFIIILSGYMADKHAKKAVPMIASGLAKVFAHYNKPEARKAITLTQNLGQCCGAMGPLDWQDGEIFHKNYDAYLTSTNADIIGNAPVPDSCCVYPWKGCGLRNNETHIDVLNTNIEFIFGSKEKYEEYDAKFEKEAEKEWDQAAYESYDDYEDTDYEDEFLDEHGDIKWEALEYKKKEHYSGDNKWDDVEYLDDGKGSGYKPWKNPPHPTKPPGSNQGSNGGSPPWSNIPNLNSGSPPPSSAPPSSGNSGSPPWSNIPNLNSGSPPSSSAPPTSAPPSSGNSGNSAMPPWMQNGPTPSSKNAGKFANKNQVNQPVARGYVFRQGCAVRFGNTIRKSRGSVIGFFVMMALPVLICIIMAHKVNKYFDELECDDLSV